MKYIQFKPAVYLYLFVVTAWLFAGCTPNSKNVELGAKPKASFTVSPVTTKVNTYLLSSNTTGSFLLKWDLGIGKGFKDGKPTDTAYFPDKGTYTVKLLALGQGGYDTVVNTITVANDDPSAITPEKLLTGNSTKIWVLQPGAGALFVGDPGGGQWWSSGLADVTAPDRTCLFNDEYTFKKDGSFLFDDKGDFRVDDEGNAPWPNDIGFPISCINSSQLPAQYKAWGSGSFKFKVIGTDKLQVIGTGAHLGLYKAGETGTIAAPEASNTYDIVELTATKLVVRKMYSWGQWRFTLTAK